MKTFPGSLGVLDIPEPKEGLDENFDSANGFVNQSKYKLEVYLDQVKS